MKKKESYKVYDALSGPPIRDEGREFTIVCRGSWLSLAQAEIFKTKVLSHFPNLKLNVIIKETAGDKNQSMPLHLVEGQDFFTREVQDALINGEADFALHSMKDVSSETFFRDGHFAIIERDNIQDVAIFNPNVLDKLIRGERLVIGTSSPRRSNMATDFLKKGLPRYDDKQVNIIAKSIRGNVDNRLKKLHDGFYDGILLAAAGLNRLLNYHPSKATVTDLLRNKKIMVLPLFECPPAAGQGAIVAETNAGNTAAIEVLSVIENKQLTVAVHKERIYAQRYGYGCSQQFGVFHQHSAEVSFTYAAGREQDQEFVEWEIENLNPINHDDHIFSSAKYMSEFFEYEFFDSILIRDETPVFFIASHKAVHSVAIRKKLKNKIIWAAGTRTWFDLANQGIWVQGCADGIGLENALGIMNSPLINIDQKDITILTNSVSANEWIKDGWSAMASYALKPIFKQAIADEISKAGTLFWTSFQQYSLYKDFVKATARHCCPVGKTAVLLKREGIAPIIFPGIKSFKEWTSKNILVTNAG